MDTKDIWLAMQPVQNQEQLARLMYCKALRLERVQKELKYFIHEGLTILNALDDEGGECQEIIEEWKAEATKITEV